MVKQLLIFSGLIISAACGFLHTAPLPIILEPIREAPVSYDFSYHVNDANTGDFKSQSEARRGDTVLGQYSLIQPDGVRRIVDYQANDLTGFVATVTNEPLINPIHLNRAPQTPEIQDNQIAQDNQRQQPQDLQQQQYQQQQIQQQQQQEQQQLQQQYHQQQQIQQHQQEQQQIQQKQQIQQQQFQDDASRSTTANAGISIENQCSSCASTTPPSVSLSTVLHPYQNKLWL